MTLPVPLRGHHYILDDEGNPVIENDFMKWSEWFATTDRTVCFQTVGEGVTISTVFLGLDHNFWDDGPPVLWETMIFGGTHDDYQVRYSSQQEAMDGHAEAVAMVRATLQ